jgi:superfamily II DNA/RNA helicase
VLHRSWMGPLRPHVSRLRWFQDSSRSYSAIPATVKDDSGIDSESILFDDLADLHPLTKAALRAQGIRAMTEIQQKTWKAAIEGQDVLGRSRTGSGKTLAFLLPSLERILRNSDRKNIKMLVVSPTRELAHQIYEATLKLTAKFGKDKASAAIHCQVCYGGIPKRQDVAQMERAMPTILTATPGRLLDHLESSTINNVRFQDCIKDVEILVLDEVDRLLDLGFRQVSSRYSFAQTIPTLPLTMTVSTGPRGRSKVLGKATRQTSAPDTTFLGDHASRSK